MAPLSSEAITAPTLTLQFDPLLNPAGAVYTITLTPINVGTANCPVAFIACYQLTTDGVYMTGGTAPARSFTIKGVVVTGTVIPPRLLVSDSDGTTLDGITLTTFKLQPVGFPSASFDIQGTTCNEDTGANCTPTPNYGEVHTAQIVITQRFDGVPNLKSLPGPPVTRLYKYALLVGGQFDGGPTGATASNDFVKLNGVGKCGANATQTTLLAVPPQSPTLPPATACNTLNSRASDPGTLLADTSYCPLKRTLAATQATTSSFSDTPILQQGPPSTYPYPRYFCDNGTDCKPTIILTLTFVFNGPDAVELPSSMTTVGGTRRAGCSIDGDDRDDCGDVLSISRQMKRAQARAVQQQLMFFAAQIPPPEPTPACVGATCLILDPEFQGTITITKHISCATCAGASTPSGPVFTFDIVGPSPSTQHINFSGALGGNDATLPPVAVIPGTYTVKEVTPLPAGWQSTGGDNCDGVSTTGVSIGSGGHITCTFFNEPIPPPPPIL